MIINFDEYKDDEPITIIENGISKTYVHPRAKLSYNPCFPPTNNIFIEIIGILLVLMKSITQVIFE